MKECWTKIEDLKIRYLESEKENKKLILFIHGLGSAADRWMRIPDQLSSEFHCIAIDLPGFGESDKPENLDYTIDQFRNFIISFLNKFSIHNEKIILIGHSLGGYIASEVTIHYKKNIQKLVLIDSSGFLDKPTPILVEYLKAAINPTQKRVRKVFEKMVADPNRVPQPLVDGFIRRINMPYAKHAFESTLANSTSIQIGLQRLRKINPIPTLVIWGIYDKVIPLNHSEFFKECLDNSRLEIIEDSGHAPFAEKPDQVCKLIKDFL